MMSIQQASEVAAFQGTGETRLVFARDTRDPSAPLFYLPQGEAERYRQTATEYLECPMHECHDRTLVVVNRAPDRRDGFRHRRGASGHGEESVNHLQGKATLLRWLNHLQSSGRLDPAVVFAAEVPVGNHERVADVLVTWPNGERVAMEVQYSGITRAALEARSASYAALGVAVVWFLGHQAQHLRFGSRGGVRLGEIQRQLLRQRQPLLWLNPERGQIATAYVGEDSPTRPGDEQFRRRPTPEDTTADLIVASLNACDVTPVGISVPCVDRIDESEATLREAIQLQRAEQDEIRRKADAASAARREAQRRRGPRVPAHDYWRGFPRTTLLPPGRAIYVRGTLSCYVCRDPLSEEVEHLGGHPGWCIDVHAESEPDEAEHIVPPDPQLSLFEPPENG